MVEKATNERRPSLARVLYVGDAQRREFCQSRRQLESIAEVRLAESIDEAVALLDGGFAAEVIVIAQAVPGQVSHEEVDRLRRAAPLARLLGLLGSWCEGESRSGHPWPGVQRLYWHQFPAQCSRELACLHGGAGSTWSLPVTAGEEERLLVAHAASPASRRRDCGGGLIAIWSHRFEMQDLLATACRLRGYATVWLAPGRTAAVSGVKAAIFDGCRCDEHEEAEMARFFSLLGAGATETVPLVALLDFPRIEDHARAIAAGAAAVLSKPLVVDDLFWHLDWALAEKP